MARVTQHRINFVDYIYSVYLLNLIFKQQQQQQLKQKAFSLFVILFH